MLFIGRAGGAQGPADPAQRLRGPHRTRPLPADRDRRRARRHHPLPGGPRDDALDRRPRPRLRREPLAPSSRGRPALRAVAVGRELRHGPDRGVRRRHSGDRLRDRRLQRRGHRRGGRRPRPPGGRAATGRGAAARPPRARAPARDGRGGADQRPALRLAAGRGSGNRGLRASDRGPRAGDDERTGRPVGRPAGPPTACLPRPRNACPRWIPRWSAAAAPSDASPAVSASVWPGRWASA